MIDQSSLPEALRKTVAPDAPAEVKAMLAMGQIPLGFADRLTVLVILESDPDEKVSRAVADGWASLDPARIASSLRDRAIGTDLLEEIAKRFPEELELALALLSHPNVGAGTFSRFVGSDDPRLLDRIANNQRVLLENPDVAARLLQNPALELSVAGRLRSLLGIAEEDIAAEEPGLAHDDAATEEIRLAAEVEFSTEIPPELLADIDETVKPEASPESTNLYQLVQTLSVAEKIKLATLGSKSARRLLSKDSNRIVVNSVIRSPKLQEDEVIVFAQDRTTPDDVLNYIMSRKDWMKNYQIKLGLCKNPKTPLPKALRLLDSIYEKDLRALAKSRNVPTQISSAALRRVLAKSGH